MAGHGSTFLQSVTLRAAAVADEPLTPDALAAEVTGALKIDKPAADAVIKEPVRAQRRRHRRDRRPAVRGDPRRGPEGGRARLTLIAQRANAELAAAA